MGEGNPEIKSQMRTLLCLFFITASHLLFAANPYVSSNNRGIEFRNEQVSLLISHTGEMLSCVELQTNNDIAVHDRRKVASVVLKNGEMVEASKLALSGSALTIWFGSTKVEVEVEVLAYKDYFTLEVKKASPEIETLTFIELTMKYDFNNSNTMVAAGVALSLQTNPVYYPTGESRRVVGSCTRQTGLEGAKLAIVTCKKDELRHSIKNIYSNLPSNSVPVNRTGGGPSALDCEANRYDCVLIGNASLSLVPDWIRFYSSLGVRQIDFMMGTTTFIQGDFTFSGLGSASAFREQITKPLVAAGFIPTLHTYSYYIGYTSNEILSNPKWQQQLEVRDIYSLSKAIGTTESVIELKGDMTSLSNDESFRRVHTPYILIDNEIIKYTIDNSGRLSCQRGQCGTKAASHSKSSKVKFLGGYFSHFVPQIGSELFYEVARRTAQAYNKGGFKGFYFDALDGLPVHLKYAGLDGFFWFYSAAFINEVLKHCDKEPLVVEYSDMNATLWAARGRGGAWDHPYRGYKNFIDDHVTNNKTWKKWQYVTTLGWYNFYPVKKSQPGDYATKYMFSDDVDYIGAKSIAYDHTMVYNGLVEKNVETIPGLKRNLVNFSRYNKLRVDNYFSEEIKSVLREGKYEYRIRKKGSRWGFDEAVYCRTKLRDAKQDCLRGNNPFGKQRPFIRLENLYSSDCTSTVPLMQFEENKSLGSQFLEKSFSTPINLTKHLGIKVSIRGNGYHSTDAICIRLRSSGISGYADYVVRLNFDGWRDIIVPNLDNAEYKDLKFEGMEDNLYRMHRKEVEFAAVRYINVYLSEDCGEVRIRNVEAVPLLNNSLTNPVVYTGHSQVMFLGELESGEYVEYSAGSKTAMIYDYMGNSRPIKVLRKGRFEVANGDFEMSVSGEASITDAPMGVVLTTGIFGRFITN